MSRKWKLFSVLMILVLILCGISFYVSKYWLTVTHYEISTEKVKEPLRIVQITDLHNREFGTGNEKLIAKVQEQNPDLIVLTGDLLNSDERDSSIATDLIHGLSKLAPVYASYGNHEKEHEETFSSDLIAQYDTAGATMLEFSFEDIEVKGQKLRLGGLYGYGTPAKYLETNEANIEECEFLAEFQNTENYTILLTHMPYTWIMNDGISEWDVDCVFTGHDHGGQIRIPLIGGLYAPDQGWFPGKDCGLYYSKDGEKVMVLSRGLGSAGKLPRFNNVPEIVVVDLVPDK